MQRRDYNKYESKSYGKQEEDEGAGAEEKRGGGAAETAAGSIGLLLAEPKRRKHVLFVLFHFCFWVLVGFGFGGESWELLEKQRE